MTAPPPPPPELWAATIGPTEIFREVVALRTEVAVMTSERANDRVADADKEARIRALEHGRWPLPSAALLLSAGALAVTVINQIWGTQ